MHRFFLESEDIIDLKSIRLNNKDSVKHLSLVLRVKIGEEIELIAPDRVYIGEVSSIEAKAIEFKIIGEFPHKNESQTQIDLYQCLPKGAKLELILQKNVELGIGKFLLVHSKRSVVDYKSKDMAKKMDRFERIIKEASKQSKRDLIPEITGVFSLEEIIPQIATYDLFIVLYENESALSLKSILTSKEIPRSKVAVFVGPEGGLTEEEVSLLRSNGAQIATIGSRILRTETAGFVATTCIQYENGGLE